MNRNFKSLISNSKFFLLAILVSIGFGSIARAGQFTLGAQFQGWNSNYAAPANYSGYELWAPLSLSFGLGSDINVYAQGEFGNAGYTASQDGSGTLYLTGFSDTVIGGSLKFKSFGSSSLLDVGFNLPTGDQSWEAKQIGANIPTQFVDSRYRGRGFGVSALYGLSFPTGSAEIGAAAGYLYSGAFNPNYGAFVGPGTQLKLGDSYFLSLNHVQPFSGNQNQIIRLSAFAFLPTQQNGSNIFQMGPNLNASYSWINPKAFSFELGGQYYFPAQRAINGQFTTEPNYSYGPRFYLTPSYAFGDFTLLGRAKYVLPNGYSTTDPLYAVCVPGFLFGAEPSLVLKLDSASSLRFSASYDYIIAQNAAFDANNNLTSVIYSRWTFGTNFEVKL